jgi:hypothetical protein
MSLNRPGFQTFVNAQPAPGEAGDFASANIRASTLSYPEGAFSAASGGVAVGRFAWGNTVSGVMSNYFQENSVLGFVHRENQGLITDFLGISSQLVPAGYPVYAMSRGEFWALMTAGATPGQTIYADPVTGLAVAGDAGLAVKVTGFTGAISTLGVLTVSVDGSPTSSLAVGQLITGTGVPAGTYITSLGSGSGGTGTYNLNQAPAGAITAEAMNAYGLIETPYTAGSTVNEDAAFTASLAVTGVLTVSAISAGSLGAGVFISGTGVPVNTVITAQKTGTTGGTGTYQTNGLKVVTSEAMTGTQGQVGKITSWA